MEAHFEILFEACRKLADVLKDPTNEGAKQLDADSRHKAREDAHANMYDILDALEGALDFTHAVTLAVNIVGHDEDDKDKK